MPFGLLRPMTGHLEKVDIALATMGGVVEQQVADSIEAFERGDALFAQEVARRDADIDGHEHDIEQMVFTILEERRPTGMALRRSMAALKLATDLERIGDLAKNIARRSAILVDLEDDLARRDTVNPVITRIGRRALTQVSESLDCLFKADAEAARAVRDADDQIDDLNDAIFKQVLSNMSQYVAGVEVGTHLIFVAKNFERIGDHATNIANRVHYTLTGDSLDDPSGGADVPVIEAVNAR